MNGLEQKRELSSQDSSKAASRSFVPLTPAKLKLSGVEEKRKEDEEKQKAEIAGMVFVKGGCFQMGDTFGGGESNEKPVHEVCVDDFNMDKYEVTQREYKRVMGENPSYSYFKSDHNPVEQVNWHKANEYCSNTGKRLPTEAEWEYAARSGGKREKYAGGNSVDSAAWYGDNSGKKTHPVGQKSPNGLGIYDMSGNVWEWVADWYDPKYYGSSPKSNPGGPDSGNSRVLRGGSWINNPTDVRASNRVKNNPDVRSNGIGFRCARTFNNLAVRASRPTDFEVVPLEVQPLLLALWAEY